MSPRTPHHPTQPRSNGTKTEIPARDLVPGDVVVIDVGDRIPADCRVLENSPVAKADEAALTGEAEPTWKDAAEKCDAK